MLLADSDSRRALLKDAEGGLIAGGRFSKDRCLTHVSLARTPFYAVRVPYLHPPGDSFEALRGGREYCSFPEVREVCHWQSSSEEEGVPRCPKKKPLVSEHNACDRSAD